MKKNNVDLGAVAKFVEQARSDPTQLCKQKRVEGVWELSDGKPQFRAVLAFPKGERTVEADQAPFMGGGGLAPDPIQYCLFGLAACFAGTFVSIASEEGVTLRGLKVVAENRVDLSKALDIADKPMVEGASITVEVDSDADERKLAELERKSRSRCPGVYCLTNPIPLTTKVRRAGR